MHQTQEKLANERYLLTNDLLTQCDEKAVKILSLKMDYLVMHHNNNYLDYKNSCLN